MVEAGAGFDDIIQRERGLRRTLSARRMSMIAIGGAIGTGLFLGSGFAISLAGPAVLLSYLLGALIALLLMGCLAEMTIAHPTSGSFGAYAEYYLGPLAGFLVRYAYWTGIVLAVGTEVTAIALYMHFWFPGSPGWPWIVGFSALLVLVNARSVNVFGAIEYWFSAIKITAIVLFIVLAAWIVWRAPPVVTGPTAAPAAPAVPAAPPVPAAPIAPAAPPVPVVPVVPPRPAVPPAPAAPAEPAAPVVPLEPPVPAIPAAPPAPPTPADVSDRASPAPASAG